MALLKTYTLAHHTAIAGARQGYHDARYNIAQNTPAVGKTPAKSKAGKSAE